MTKEGSRTLSAALTQSSWVLIVQGEEITRLLIIYFSRRETDEGLWGAGGG